MKALILAAGLGTRLKPLTDSIPKALVEVDGVPMLERVILNLKEKGFHRIVVNVHHFSDKVKEFLNQRNYDIDIQISDETQELLDTGGGIVKAGEILFKNDDSPALIHNVDILSNSDINTLMKKITSDKAGALLLVSDRVSSRKLLWDNNMELQGWHDLKNNYYRPSLTIEKLNYRELAFSGIYAISKSGWEEMKKLQGENKFPVMDYFLHEKRKEKILGFEQPGFKVLDIGKPATLLQAPELLKDFRIISN